MPTYTKIKFIMDKLDKGRVTEIGIVWDKVFSKGEVHRMHITEASKFVKEGYAVFV